jgi:hypothetical protein
LRTDFLIASSFKARMKTYTVSEDMITRVSIMRIYCFLIGTRSLAGIDLGSLRFGRLADISFKSLRNAIAITQTMSNMIIDKISITLINAN